MNIKDILPHREPFLFVDKVIDFNQSQIIGKSNFKDKFAFQNQIDSFDLLEANAQLAGLFLSQNIEQKQIGFLSKIYHLDIVQSFSMNSDFILESQLIDNIENLYIFQAKSLLKNKEIMSCQFAIALIENNFSQTKQNILLNNNNLFEILDKQNNQIALKFNEDNILFSGHFPNFPIVPGIYLSKIAYHLLDKECLKMQNVKFQNLCLPNEKINFNFIEKENLINCVIKNNNNQLKAMLQFTRH